MRHGSAVSGEYELAFRANDVDAQVLPRLTAEDLISIGLTSVGAPSAAARRNRGTRRGGASRYCPDSRRG